jgi:hypothetical protein
MSSGLFVFLCFVSFKLGEFAERNPGQLWLRSRLAAAWIVWTLGVTFDALPRPRLRPSLKGGKMRAIMSMGTVLLLAAFYGFFQLGAYNERHPGQIMEKCKRTYEWVWSSLNQ